MRLIDRDEILNRIGAIVSKFPEEYDEKTYKMIRCEIRNKNREVKAIPIEWIEKWINDRTKIWINPKYADMEFTEVPLDYYVNFTPYQVISMLEDWGKENESDRC